MTSQATAEGIFSMMDKALQKHQISWNNCVGLAVDNTSVNVGCRNSIKTRTQNINPAVFVMGCPCQILWKKRIVHLRR